MTKSRLYIPSNETFDLATKKLADGDIVSFPTETVYGLGADATNSTAVAKIYAAKNRPSINPLIVHLSDAKKADLYVHINPTAQKLADNFWPGPFTMVLPLREQSGLSDLITAGLDTVAVRVPMNNVAHKLLQKFDGPIAAPSANKSGNISPTTAAHVDGEFGDELDMIIDGGACDKGLESTIVQIDESGITLLRPGNITPKDIEKVTGQAIQINDQPTDNPVAPGQLKSHYAPNTKMRLNAAKQGPAEAYLAFGHNSNTENSLNLSPSGDLVEAAANLFSMMRELDRLNLEAIAVAPIPNTGLGIAINDRLERAAAPRETKL
tara:strand:- start:116846 stop:117814 length:969 start_codon:yes stop_codon:yes gene_type:complete